MDGQPIDLSGLIGRGAPARLATMSAVAANEDLRALLGDEIDRIAEAVASLSDEELVLPSGCAGWLVAHLLVHLRLGSEAVLESFVSLTDKPADRDSVSYWRDWPARGTTGFGDVRWHWANAAAYADADRLRAHFADTARAAAAAARHSPDGRFDFQEHVLEGADVLAMWIVEYAIHHLDLAAAVPRLGDPDSRALAIAVRTLDALLDGERLERWDDATYLRKGTGRMALDDTERSALGDRAARYPAFG